MLQKSLLQMMPPYHHVIVNKVKLISYYNKYVDSMWVGRYLKFVGNYGLDQSFRDIRILIRTVLRYSIKD